MNSKCWYMFLNYWATVWDEPRVAQILPLVCGSYHRTWKAKRDERYKLGTVGYVDHRF